MKKTLLFAVALLTALGSPALAQGVTKLVQVPVPAGSSDPIPTSTLLFEVENPQLTLLVILGGNGRAGFKETSNGMGNPLSRMTQLLTHREFSPLRINVAVFDSPVELNLSWMRAERAHLDRVESTVRYYQDRFKAPVWIFGHSSGTVSASEYLVRKQAATPAAGVVLSGSARLLNLKDGMNQPLLFLHHEEDGCGNTPFGEARRNFQRAQKLNKAVTEMLVVRGGQEQNDPCTGGKHMYFGANEEAARQIANFLERAQK